MLVYFSFVCPNVYRNRVLKWLDIKYDAKPRRASHDINACWIYVSALAGGFTLLVASWVLMPFAGVSGFGAGLFVLPAIVSYICLALTAIEHFRPNGRRSVKYSWFAYAMVCELVYGLNVSFLLRQSACIPIIFLGIQTFALVMLAAGIHAVLHMTCIGRERPLWATLALRFVLSVLLLLHWYYIINLYDRLTIGDGIITLHHPATIIAFVFTTIIAFSIYSLFAQRDVSCLALWAGRFRIMSPLSYLLLLLFVLRSGALFVGIICPHLLGGGTLWASRITVAMPAFLMIALAFRFSLGRRLEEKPILYLRSFANPESPEAYGRIIGAVANRYLPVKALVHGNQPAHELLRHTSLEHAAKVSTVADEHWQEWVLAEIKTASLIILDASTFTESVKWELETSMKEAGAFSRVLILSHVKSEKAFHEDDFGGRTFHMVYGFSEEEAFLSRAGIEMFIKESLNQ